MSSPGLPFVVQQLVYQTPVLLVYLVGLILALVFLGRFTVPSVLTLIALGTLLLTAVGMAVLQAYLIGAREDAGWSMEQYARMMSILGFVASFVRAAALALLITAVFVGRSGRPAAASRGNVPSVEAADPDTRFRA